MSLAICVSFWMLMSFSVVMLSPSPGRRGAGGGCSGAAGWAASAPGAVGGVSDAGSPFAVRGGAGRLGLLAMDVLQHEMDCLVSEVDRDL
jgi:hypothetical protein